MWALICWHKCYKPIEMRGCFFIPGWSGGAASRDGGGSGQLPGGGGVPGAGAAEGTGPSQQELPHPAVPAEEGWAEEPAGGSDGPGGRRSAAQPGAGPEGAFSVTPYPNAGNIFTEFNSQVELLLHYLQVYTVFITGKKNEQWFSISSKVTLDLQC